MRYNYPVTTVSVSTRRGIGAQVAPNVLAAFRGLDVPAPPTYVAPDLGKPAPREMPPAVFGSMPAWEHDVYARCPREVVVVTPASEKPDRIERATELEKLLSSCILSGAAHMDSSVDLIQSRPTLGAIRESSKRKAILKDRAIRVREQLPQQDRVHTPLPPTPASLVKPKNNCRWCGAFRDIMGDGLCQPCTYNPTVRRIREHYQGTADQLVQAPVVAPVARTAAPVAPVAAVQPAKPATSVRMQRQVGPDGKIRFVRV